MPQELAYVIITPHSLHKSRTGGIIARLISRSGVDLVAARMFAPSPELTREYADNIVSADDPQERKIQELIRDYIQSQFAPDPKSGLRRRVMLLLFQGEDAVRKIRAVVGTFRLHHRGGETIRDTYGDLVLDENENVRYFEPAVLAAPTAQEVKTKLQIWAKHSDADGGVLDGVVAYSPGEVGERTLVLIKPENFRFPTGKPGNMIDFFSRTGLFIVAIKVHRMSTASAVEFYGPVRDILRSKLKDSVASRARAAIEKELQFSIPPTEEKQLGELLGPLFGDNQFDNIVRFMSGRAACECPADQMNQPGTEKCIALVYEGVNAVSKIREVLGPTDPSKAPPGSIRREFGSTIMVNAAHASDSAENSKREIGIVNVAENTFRKIVDSFYA